MRTANQWPKSDFASMQAFYGNVGEHQTTIRTPYPLRLAWDTKTTVSRITVHRKTAESVLKVMDTVLYLYGFDAIKALNLDLWAGCLNVRKMRGGSQFSIHSWGAAHDWYPSKNGLRTPWHLSAFSAPVYIDFFNAWIYEGWDPLGISINRDAMHFQATDNAVMPLSTSGMLQQVG